MPRSSAARVRFPWTRPTNLTIDEEGFPHGLIGERLTKAEHDFLQSDAITAFDSDSGMTMLRIGSMNLMLHGIERPHFTYADTLSKAFTEEKQYDLILANPPFKGAIDSSDVNPTLPTKVRKTEILFLHLFLRLLEVGGRAAVIVPDGILFGTSNAHTEMRRKLVEENRLDAVISMPSGVFKPYAGVSTAVLVFTKGAATENIWFYDMEHDGFSLDDKRQKVSENDIPDILDCWKNRHEPTFADKRAHRLAELRKQIEPLKAQRLTLLAAVSRLTFERAIAGDHNSEEARVALETDERKLALLHGQLAPLQTEINQLTRQFWVSKERVKANRFELSASRYRQVERDEEFYESPQLTLQRLRRLEAVATSAISAIESLLGAP